MHTYIYIYTYIYIITMGYAPIVGNTTPIKNPPRHQHGLGSCCPNCPGHRQELLSSWHQASSKVEQNCKIGEEVLRGNGCKQVLSNGFFVLDNG